jgi:hypothetical protein
MNRLHEPCQIPFRLEEPNQAVRFYVSEDYVDTSTHNVIHQVGAGEIKDSKDDTKWFRRTG